jgi:hypothetical protein
MTTSFFSPLHVTVKSCVNLYILVPIYGAYFFADLIVRFTDSSKITLDIARFYGYLYLNKNSDV